MLWSTIIKTALQKVLPVLLVDLGKVVLEKIADLGKAPAMNSQSQVAEIEQINNSIKEAREQVLDMGSKIASNVSEAMRAFTEEQKLLLEDHDALLKRNQISPQVLMGRLSDTKNKLERIWNRALYQKISLDNCHEILLLPPGQKKAIEMQRVCEHILSETIAECIDYTQAEVEEIYAEWKDNIAESIEKLEKTVNEYQVLVDSIDSNDEEKKDNILLKAHLNLTLCEGILEKVGDN